MNEALVIDKAYFNRHNHSFIETYVTVLESSVSLLLKNIKRLERGAYQAEKPKIYYNPIYRSTKFKQQSKIYL